jgi:hypothetical protein
MDDPHVSTSQKRTPSWWSCSPGPAAWLLGISSPHPQEPMQKGLTKGTVAGFYIIMLTSQENINQKTQQFFLVFYKLSKSNAPEAMESTPLHASLRSHHLFNNSSVFSSNFWLVVLCWFTNWQPITATIFFCVLLHLTPQTMGHPGCASSTSSHLPRLPTFG